MRFSMLYSGEQILSFKSCLVFYAGDSLNNAVRAIEPRPRFCCGSLALCYPVLDEDFSLSSELLKKTSK